MAHAITGSVEEMIKNYIVTGIVVTGFVAAWMGCSSNSGGGTTGTTLGTGAGATVGSTVQSGTGTNTGTASTGSTGTGAATSSGTTTGGGGSMGVGGASANLTCMVPATPPSKGSCVTFVGVDGGEADGGLDSMGNGSITICDPITNAGCTGTDVCGLDTSGKYWDCFEGGNPPIPLCGNCSASTAICADGTFCVGFGAMGSPDAWCAQLCCSNADCGTGGTCDMMAFGMGNELPNSVGICD
jgi:hypothetical protein